MARFAGGSKLVEASNLYIDGAYLDIVVENTSKDFFHDDAIEIDYMKVDGKFKRVFYYHSLPGKRKSENNQEFEERINAKRSEFARLSKLEGFHVVQGTVRRESERNRQKKLTST